MAHSEWAAEGMAGASPQGLLPGSLLCSPEPRERGQGAGRSMGTCKGVVQPSPGRKEWRQS